MKSGSAKKEAQERVEVFFRQSEISAGEVKKIKRLAMRHNIKLGEHRKRFCRECYSDLKNGKVRVSKKYKTVICGKCGEKNRFKIS